MSRPRLHLTPRTGWVNDPYGLTWHGGRYHLFFQRVPDQAVWAVEQHWGHAVSDDLLHWTELDPALSPGDGDGGIWSGSVAGGRLFYSSVRADAPELATIRSATPVDDSWTTWRKGPVLVTAPPELSLTQFRDPFVLADGDRWRMVVGAGDSTGTAMALSWVSDDLDDWTYDGILSSRSSAEQPWTGAVWECPQLVRVEDRWVLVVSVWADGVTHHEAAAVGTLAVGAFETGRSSGVETWRRLTYGPAPYAGSAFTDRDGRPCLIHWLREVTGDGWAGAHSVPHVLTVRDDRVVLEPHPVVASHLEELAPGASRRIGDALLEHRGEDLVVTLPGDTVTMPTAGELVQVLVDEPVVEVFSALGVAGFSSRR